MKINFAEQHIKTQLYFLSNLYCLFIHVTTLSTFGYICAVNIALHNFHSTSCSLPFYIGINAQIAVQAYNNVTDVLQKLSLNC